MKFFERRNDVSKKGCHKWTAYSYKMNLPETFTNFHSFEELDIRIWYGNDKVYYQDASSKKLVSFPLSAVQKKSKAVRLVATGELSDIAPYGGGYHLERSKEEWDKIALKMLEQDTDCDLAGIEGYLEYCFLLYPRGSCHRG